MYNPALSGFTLDCRVKRAFHLPATLLISCCALVLFCTLSAALAQDSKTPSVLPPPSPGKALVCIYRVGRFTGSASHDELFVNGVHVAKLLNGEYVSTEVAPGTVVISGLTKMYYGSVIMSAGAALNDARKKENERIRFEAEAGKTYYLKWTAGTMATMVKVTPVDVVTGAREMSKLHLSKPPEDKDTQKPETK